VAIVEDGRVAEVQIERRGKGSVVGHIWKGRVESVLAGMEASFIEVGIGKNGFLHVDDVVAKGVPKRKRLIADLLKKGDEVIVQALKDPMGTKGARLTMQLSLAGRFLVYVPFGDGIGISKRLDDDERHRLRDICKRLPTDGGGVIVRTAAAGASASELARDLASLNLLWKAIRERADKVQGPSLLYSEADSSLKVIRDILNETVDEVIVDDARQHERIVGFLRRTSPELADRVRLWDGDGSLMEAQGVEAAIRSTLSRRVPLASGGSLVIDDTEAMTVVDVNSGKNVGRGNTQLEATITRTNLEAAEEVVRQLRLRDIGGIIVIDFIDMDDAKNRRAVTKALNDALAKDRSRTFVVEISPLGLVQMTRQNISDGVREIMTQACPTCGGQGFVVSPETHAIDAERQIRLLLAGADGDSHAVAVHPEVADYLQGDDGAPLAEMEEDLGVTIALERDPSMAPGSARLGGAGAPTRRRRSGGRSRSRTGAEAGTG
jgi:ribonuclease G